MKEIKDMHLHHERTFNAMHLMYDLNNVFNQNIVCSNQGKFAYEKLNCDSQ